MALAFPSAAQTTATPISLTVTGPVPIYSAGTSVTVPAGQGTITDLTVTLHNVSLTSSWANMSALLVGPTGRIILTALAADDCSYDGVSNLTVVLSDSASALPTASCIEFPSSATVTYKPAAHATPDSFPVCGTGCPMPAPAGSASLTSTFVGDDPAGTWTLYIGLHSFDAVTVGGGWTLTLTTAGAAEATTTALSSSRNPSYTTAPNNSVTFTATVTSGGSPVTGGTVTFNDGGSAISGAVALDGSGQASFTTSSLIEGTHSITAAYSGTTGYALSVSDTLSQIVTVHPTQTDNKFCNPSSIAIPASGVGSEPIGSAAQRYPSYLDVSLAGTITNMAFSVSGLTHNDLNDVDMMLVSPTGQKLVLWSDIGPGSAASNLNITLDDSGATLLPSGSVPTTGSTYRPASYAGFYTDQWPSPAPSGATYATTDGSGTMALFNGNNPAGLWALYIMDQGGAGGSTGSLAGGWCLDFTLASPDLTINKSHGENFRQGGSGTYSVVVTNSGSGPTSGAVTVTDTPPLGLTIPNMSGDGWTCTAQACTRSDALAAGDSYPAITVAVDVDDDAPASVTNTAVVTGGGAVTPGSDSDFTTIDPVADLTVTKTHTGDFSQGQSEATYTVTVRNSGAGPTVGAVTLTETVQTGFTLTGMSGTGWNCGTLPNCTRSDAWPANTNYPPITVTVNVDHDAPSSVTNSVTVSGGGELNTTNNVATDATNITQLPDLTVTKTHTGHFTRGQVGTYTITVSNVGSVATTGTVTVTDTLPAGLTAAAIASVPGWSCAPGPPVVCNRADALNQGSSYPPISLVVDVDPAASTPLINSVTVTASPDSNAGNNTATDSTVVLVVPGITWATPAPITYGTALSATQLNAAPTVPGTLVYSPPSGTVLEAGPHVLTATFTPTDQNTYATAVATVNLTVNKATPVIAWATPAAITYGTALSGTQLNASTPPAGTFDYSPPAGTVLPAGDGALNVTFTPADTLNYNTAVASVTLHVNKANPVITWATPAPITYPTPLSAAQLNASPSVPGSFVYTPAAGAVLTPGSNTLDVTFTPADTVNYNAGTASVTLVVNKATPVITWATPAPIVYGTALSATQLNASASVPGSFVYSPAAGAVPTAGDNTLNVTFTPTDTVNYANATASVTLVVNKAMPAITWANPTAITYGTALSATQLNASAGVPGSFVYSPAAGAVLPGGSNSLGVTFTPADSINYSNATASVTLVVNKATPVITWISPAAIVYPAALSATQLNATCTAAGTFEYTPAAGTVLAAGNNTLNVTFTPTDSANYTGATASVTLTVNKGTPVITWAAPAAIAYGTALSATQLSATANTAGSFAYTPPAGTVLAVGGHTLGVAFTPTDTANWNNANATAPLTVNKATPAVTWAAPAAIVYGTPLGAAQLAATANVAGTFEYTPPAGTVLAAGSHTLGAAFTPTDTANYNPAGATVLLTVNKATPVITWDTPARITAGTPLGAAQLSATANVPGTFAYTPPAGTVLTGGSHTLSVAFTPAGANNYNSATATVTLQVGSQEQSISFAPIADRWYGDATVSLNATASSGLPVTFAVVSGPASASGNTLTVTGVGLVTVIARQAGDAAWSPAEATQSFRSCYRTRVTAAPGSITFSVDGVAYLSSAEFLWDAGTTHQLSAAVFQATMPGVGYRFGNWSDGGAAAHSVTVAARDATYTATFIPQFLLTVEVKPDATAGRVEVTPESANGFHDAGSRVQLHAYPEKRYHFNGYTGGATGQDRSIQAEMTAAKTVVATFALGMKLDAIVDAAGYRPGPLAPGGLYSLFGWAMGTTEMASLPLPARLGGCTITIRDRVGTEKPAMLLYVSEQQVNFMVPEGLAAGPATLRVTNDAGESAEIAIEIAGVAPGLFTANQNGQGAPAGTWLLVAGDGTRTERALAYCGTDGCVPAEIDLGGPEDQIFLTLYGTGVRNGSVVTARIGGVTAPVLYAGAQGFFAGLDQINVRVPRELTGRGECDVLVTVDGIAANAVRVKLR